MRHFGRFIGVAAIATAALLVFGGETARADTIYAQGQSAATNGPYGGNNPFSQGTTFVANDFSVSGSYTLESVTFNAFTTSGTVAVTDFYINIYADSAGSLGSLLYSEHVTGSNSGVYTGTDGSYDLRDYTFNLTSGQVLTDGDYWVAMHVDPDQWDMHWTIASNAAIGSGSLISTNGGSSYSSYSWEHTFRLEGSPVPEPGTWALMGLGLLGLAYGRKRKAQILAS